MPPANMGVGQTNPPQLQNLIKHLVTQQVIRMLPDTATNPAGDLGVARISMGSVRTVTSSPDLIDPSDFQVNINAGVATENLPAASDGGRVLFIENLGTSVAVTPSGSDTVNGIPAAFNLTSVKEYILLISDSVSNWTVFGHGVGSGSPPAGAAGNDLTGTYPNPYVHSLSKMNVQVQSSGTKSVANNGDFLWIASGAGVTFNLQAANSGGYKICVAFKALSGCNFTINAFYPNTIDGQSTFVGLSNDWVILQSDGVSNWNVISSSLITTSSPINNNSAQTTVNGSVSGTIIWTAPEQGTAYKNVIIQFGAFNDAGTTVVFPTAFNSAPIVTANSTGIVVTTSTTAATIPVSAGASGWVIIEGF